MNETPSQYVARIESFVAGKDPLEVQKQTVATLTELTNNVSHDLLTREPAPGKWSVGEILAHLADVEVANTWRYRQMVEYEGVVLNSYDQEVWARLGDYRSIDPMQSLDLFRVLREKNKQLFTRLTPDEWNRTGMHVERGKLTIRDLVRLIAGHDLNHIAQVRAIVGKPE